MPKVLHGEILENAENDLTPWMRNLLELLWDEWRMVEQQINNRRRSVRTFYSEDGSEGLD